MAFFQGAQSIKIFGSAFNVVHVRHVTNLDSSNVGNNINSFNDNSIRIRGPRFHYPHDEDDDQMPTRASTSKDNREKEDHSEPPPPQRAHLGPPHNTVFNDGINDYSRNHYHGPRRHLGTRKQPLYEEEIPYMDPSPVKSPPPLNFNGMAKKALSQRPAVPEMDHSVASTSPSHLSPYNEALHRSHSNPSHMKVPANLTTTPQIDNNGNNVPNKLTHLSASGFNFPPSSGGGSIFRTINGILTKYLNNFHQTNIIRENNAIAFSFNDNFLVRLSGRHSFPATVAYKDEMHGTKEGPDAPIKTRSVDSPGNHKTFSDRHQLDNFCPNDGVDRNNGIITTQVLIAAEGALKYVRDPGKKAEIQATFLELRIDESQYTVLAGFNEGLIQSGFGYLEEIHVFCRVEILSSPHFLAKLGKVLTPYPGVLFTPSFGYKTPVFKDDGTIWDYDDLSLDRAETLSAIRIEEILQSKLNAFASLTESQPSISVTASGRPGAVGNDNYGITLGEKFRGHSDNYNHDCKRNSNLDDNDESDDDPDDPDDTGNRNSSTPGISFRVQTEIFMGTPLSSSSRPFQTFKINGIFEVQTTPGQFAPRRLPSKSHVEFKKIKFQSRKSINRAYEQVYAGVEIDAKDEYTEIEVLQPLTPGFNQATQEITAEKGTMGGTVVHSVAAVLPSSSTESTKPHSRITEDYSDGVVSWGFCVDDTHERQTGIRFGAHRALPSVNFKFYGMSDSDPPPPPPKRFDVLVKSCWSLIPPANCSIESAWVPMSKGLFPGLPAYEVLSYSNFCQFVILEVPSDLDRFQSASNPVVGSLS